MLALFYRLLILLSRVIGPWSCDLIARGIAAGYFLFSPRRVAVSMRFYQALFPRHTHVYYLGCTWKQYRNFTSVYLDRILLNADGVVPYATSGWEHLEAAIECNRGGVILMSYLGNWEIAAHLMKQKLTRLRLILFMGARAKAQIERIQKEDLQKKGIRIITADKDQGGTYDLLEALRFIQSGGLVSITGDKLWNTGQRVVPATFLGHEILLPETPHLLAMLSGAPIFIFFSRRTGNRQYYFSLSPPVHIEPVTRSERAAVIRRSVQNYADLLEINLRENPFEWYHFEPFLGSKST
ncbi:MAG: lysophospholipid acyltransferase family protein [Desulfobacterales bacterium]|jgi:predicted LPLAT superfamily acyltransferase